MSSIEFTQQDGAISGRVGGFAVNSVGGRCKGLNHSWIMEQTMLEDVDNLLTAEKSQHLLCYSLNVRLKIWADTCQIWHLAKSGWRHCQNWSRAGEAAASSES